MHNHDDDNDHCAAIDLEYRPANPRLPPYFFSNAYLNTSSSICVLLEVYFSHHHVIHMPRHVFGSDIAWRVGGSETAEKNPHVVDVDTHTDKLSVP